MRFDLQTEISILSLNQISIIWYQKFAQSIGNKIKKELAIFVDFEESYGKNKRGGKFAAPCINLAFLPFKQPILAFYTSYSGTYFQGFKT